MKKYSYIIAALLIVSQLPAQAYLDPGTGSLVLQVIIATFAGIAIWIKAQWQAIKTFFNNLFNKNKEK